MTSQIAEWQREELDHVVDRLIDTYKDDKGINHIDGLNLPQRHVVYEVMDALFRVIYPGYIGEEPVRRANQRYYIGEILAEVSDQLYDQVTKALLTPLDQFDQALAVDPEHVTAQSILQGVEIVFERKHFQIF